MPDPRIVQLAKMLTDWSIKINPGDIIEIDADAEAQPLILEIAKNILQKDAIPMLNAGIPGYSYTYYKYASSKILSRYPKIAMYEAKNVAGSIGIGTPQNTRELTHIDPKKIAMRMKATHPVSEVYLKRDNWVITEWPTHALAQDAEMSLEEFEDFYFKACLMDWKKELQKQKKLKAVLDKGKTVRIIGEDTDITLGIEGRKAITAEGKRNMPDGEVFIAPVEKKTEGHIHYTFPGIYAGKQVDDIQLWFKKGRIIKAKAEKNQSLLNAMLNTDTGSRYLGELGIGTNFNIKQFVKNILFDEKIGGTVHLAVGMAYKEGGGKNESAVHWDMIKDLRKKGEILVDDECIQKNGKFRIKGLN